MFKVPLLWEMKGSFFNTFIVLYYAFICILFAQRLLNDSFNDSFFQTPPLSYANLLWLVRLDFHSDQREKTNKWAGNMFNVDVNMKRLEIYCKNNLFQWFSVTLS